MAKSNRKQVLGRGLSAILNNPDNLTKSINDSNSKESVGKIIDLPLEKIITNPNQPRTYFNEEALNELSKSIQELGIIQPITVRKVDENNYQLISGERRYRASKMAGINNIPSYIRLANDNELLELALVENIQRQDLDPIEIGLSYKRLIDEINLTQDQLSERVGKKRSTITNYMRLLKLDPVIQTGIRDKFISMGHGRALVNIENNKEQIEIYKKIVKKNLSVRDVEKLVQISKSKAPKNTKYTSPFISQTALDLEKYFETPIRVFSNPEGKGFLKINFESQEKLEYIINKIKGEN